MNWTAAMVAMALGCVPLAGHAAETAWQPLGPWRFAEGAAAPWQPSGSAAPDRALRGETVRFAPGRVEAPAPLGCEPAGYEVVLQPAEGLFEGNLPAPADAAARALGFPTFPVATLRVTCGNASFDYHFRDDATLLTALDHVVWRLERRGVADRPADVVQRLLLDHVTHDMGFTAESFARKTPWLAPDLVELGRRALAAQADTEEAPVVDGDPFTDSQEYPERFALGPTREDDGRATVPVHFADAHRGREVAYLLERAGGAWRVTDVRYGRDGSTLRALLQAAVDAAPAGTGGPGAP